MISYNNDLKQFYYFCIKTFHGEISLKNRDNISIDINLLDLQILKSFVADLFDKQKVDIKSKRMYVNRSISRKISIRNGPSNDSREQTCGNSTKRL